MTILRLCADSAFTTIAFNLTELRQHGQELLDDASEALINNLAIDGFQGWGNHYDLLSGEQRFTMQTAASCRRAKRKTASNLAWTKPIARTPLPAGRRLGARMRRLLPTR